MIYTYKCDRCGVTEEKTQTIAEAEEFLASRPLCPDINCGEWGKNGDGEQVCWRSNVKRIITNTTFALKGRSWHRDGYK